MKTLIKEIIDRHQDRRSEPRYSLSGTLPGEFKGQEGREFHARPVDISRRGLGLLLDPAPSPGIIIDLELEDASPEQAVQVLSFTVRHVHDTPIRCVSGLVDLKRCGLELIDPDRTIDLLHFFARYDTLIIQE